MPAVDDKDFAESLQYALPISVQLPLSPILVGKVIFGKRLSPNMRSNKVTEVLLIR